MSRFGKYILLLFLMVSCGNLGLYSDSKGGIVASVSSNLLYEKDISDYFKSHPYFSDSDSIVLRNCFIDNWILSKVLQHAANANLSSSSSLSVSEIEERVNQYRDQLILFEFENSFVESSLDTVISMQSIQDYYNSHLSSFKLSAPIIKCSIARIPAGVRQTSKLENLFISKKSDEYSEFLEICNKNSYLLIDYSDNWVDLSEVLKIVPISVHNADNIFPKRSFYSVEDDTWRYMVRIDSYLPTGSLIPLDREYLNIKKILLHDRRILLRKILEDSILNSAYTQGIIRKL